MSPLVVQAATASSPARAAQTRRSAFIGISWHAAMHALRLLMAAGRFPRYRSKQVSAPVYSPGDPATVIGVSAGSPAVEPGPRLDGAVLGQRLVFGMLGAGRAGVVGQDPQPCPDRKPLRDLAIRRV